MQIKQISVTGLFGIFDHVIPLNMDERITIIHSPNGFGKTAMLRILAGFFNFKYATLFSTPFSTFVIEFNNEISFEIKKELNDSNNNITFILHKSDSENLVCLTRFPEENNSSDESDRFVKWLNQSIRDQDLSPKKELFFNEPGWLLDLRNSVNIHLIESQRLLNVESQTSSFYLGSKKSTTVSTVSTYSDEIAELMRSKFTEYGVIAQSLDRTFPHRLVKQQASLHSTDEQLRGRLDKLEITRSRLIEVGLLEKNEKSDFQIQPEDAINEGTRNILSVYVDDVEAKLGVFDGVAKKIDLLRRIINSKFSFSYKEMNFDKDKGFIFKSLYDHSNSRTILPMDLSSGEQHELVLLYELLFKVQPNSLVLIDEPELSLHVGWQVQFLNDLQEIIKLTDFGILMATHAPGIIQDRWDLTVELKRPEV
jgi:predicted ATPase